MNRESSTHAAFHFEVPFQSLFHSGRALAFFLVTAMGATARAAIPSSCFGAKWST